MEDSTDANTLEILMHETNEADRKKAALTLPHNTNLYVSKELALTPFTSHPISAIVGCLIRSLELQKEVNSKAMKAALLSIREKESQMQEECSIIYLNNLVQKANFSKTK